jgi:hypothetical protein
VAVGAVAGRAKRNGRWHSHKREARNTKDISTTEISRDAPEPFAALRHQKYTFSSECTVRPLRCAFPSREYDETAQPRKHQPRGGGDRNRGRTNEGHRGDVIVQLPEQLPTVTVAVLEDSLRFRRVRQDGQARRVDGEVCTSTIEIHVP